MSNTALLLLAAIGDVNDPATLYKLHRKVRKQLRVVGIDPDKKAATRPAPNAVLQQPNQGVAAPAPMATASKSPGVGDVIVFGTTHGEQTKAKITKVNRKRFQVELLEQRGKRKVEPIGTKLDVDPRQYNVISA